MSDKCLFCGSRPREGLDKRHQLCRKCSKKYFNDETVLKSVCCICTQDFVPAFSSSESKCQQCVEREKKTREKEEKKVPRATISTKDLGTSEEKVPREKERSHDITKARTRERDSRMERDTRVQREEGA